ncbi:MAG: nuclear transport factor 2 family protein [Firmicutes bacterium]|nr:nuclear transport factor 2 family protein [Bacillota bacterium]
MKKYEEYRKQLEANKELLRKWMMAGDTGNREQYVALTHPEHTVVNAVDPDAKSVLDYEEHWNYLEEQKKAFSFMEHKPVEIYADGSCVMAKGQVTAENANGRMEFPFAIFCTVKEGKILETSSIASIPTPKK